MKSIYCTLLIITSLLTGCVANTSNVDQNTVSSISHIHIAPMEVPPLSGTDLSGVSFPGAALPVIGGVLVIAQIPKADAKSTAASKAVESLLDSKENWEPSVEIANETMRQLRTAGNFSVDISSKIKPMPGVQRREATAFMENWMAPIRTWYNRDTSPFDYSNRLSSDAVLEVGLSNYELSIGRFIMQVHMKLVDPASGNVIANARSSSILRVRDLNGLFEHGGVGFKQLFRTTTRILVRDSIEKLGLNKV